MKKQIEYLLKMTDDFGIIQFANKNLPDISTGYTLDDVSRALIVSAKLEKNYPELKNATKTYLNFIKNAQTLEGRFINFFDGSKKPTEEVGSPDSFGRTLWALGEYFKIKRDSKEILLKSLDSLEKEPLQDPISEAFALLGLSKMYESGVYRQKTKELIQQISDSLIEKIKSNLDENWLWPDDEMTYENARIPQAFFNAYNVLENAEYFYYAENLTEFLDKQVFKEKPGRIKLNVIGNKESGLKGSWLKKGGIKPEYDEQPVDVGAMVELHIDAHKSKNENPYHLDRAKKAFAWFNGANRLNKIMISPKGGIYDGLKESNVNPNQGAESLLAYMMARIKLDSIIKN